MISQKSSDGSHAHSLSVFRPFGSATRSEPRSETLVASACFVSQNVDLQTEHISLSTEPIPISAEDVGVGCTTLGVDFMPAASAPCEVFFRVDLSFENFGLFASHRELLDSVLRSLQPLSVGVKVSRTVFGYRF